MNYQQSPATCAPSLRPILTTFRGGGTAEVTSAPSSSCNSNLAPGSPLNLRAQPGDGMMQVRQQRHLCVASEAWAQSAHGQNLTAGVRQEPWIESEAGEKTDGPGGECVI